MRKVRTDTKAEKSNDTLFESESSSESQNLSLVNSSEILRTDESTTFKEKLSPLLNLIKQVFLFLPGTFLLYLIGFVGTIILLSSFSVREPMEIFGIHSAPLQFLLFSIIAILGTFMTWFGLGDIKNKRHSAIPISILVTGGAIAATAMILGSLFGFTGLFEVINYYFIYLFPLVLIVPVLVKGWIDRKSETENYS